MATERELMDRWEQLLLRASRLTHQRDGDMHQEQPTRRGAAPWYGRPPANDRDIAAAEKRLKVKLSPELRAFYKTTDGWGPLGTFVYSFRPLAKLQWSFQDPMLDELIEMNMDNAEGNRKWLHADSTRPGRALILSSDADSGWVLLDPKEPEGRFGAGSWYAWTGEGFEWHPDLFAFVEAALRLD